MSHGQKGTPHSASSTTHEEAVTSFPWWRSRKRGPRTSEQSEQVSEGTSAAEELPREGTGGAAGRVSPKAHTSGL